MNNQITFLLTTVNKNVNDIIELCRLNNVEGNIVVGSQKSANDEIVNLSINNSIIKIVFQTSKGTSINRNRIFREVNTKYCIFLDDDILLLNQFPLILNEAISKFGDFDFCFFGLSFKDKNIKSSFKKCGRLRKYHLRSYGVNSVVFKTSFLRNNNLIFDEKLGPGTLECSGEDVDFLFRCYKKTKKAYGYPKTIIEISYDNGSTWFNGYDNDFFKRLGKSYKKNFGIFYKPLIIYTLIKHKKTYLKNIPFRKAYKLALGKCIE